MQDHWEVFQLFWPFWQLASEKGQSEEFNDNHDEESSTEDDNDPDVLHYVALGSDNAWYMFTARSVKSVHTNSVNFGASTPGGKPVEELLKEKLQVGIRKWENLGRSGSGPLGCVWSADSSIDTWGWGCQVPVLSELSGAHEVLSLTLLDAWVLNMLFKHPSILLYLVS